MRQNLKKTVAACALLLLLGAAGCSGGYSLSGAKIPAAAETVSIPFFQNNAPLVAPSLSPTFTDAMQEKFASQTRLSLIPEDGDLALSGAIVGYSAVPTAVTASDDFPASMMRLTITVRVSFVNRIEPEWNFQNRTFSQYEDFPSDQTLQSQEGNLIPIIVKKLVDDIYMAAVANW